MTNKFFKYLPFLALTVSLCVTSCSKDDDNDDNQSETQKYVYGAQSEGSFYVTTFGEIPGTGSITSDFSKAVTLVSGHLFLEKYGDFVYANSGAMGDGNGGEQTLRKYSVNSTGGLTEVANLTFPNAPSVVEIMFVSETKAYAVCYKSGSLIIFNPTTMKETGTLDLSAYAASGQVVGGSAVESDGNPDAGSGIIVDGKLYLPLNQFNGGMTNFQALDVDGQIAIIDVATDKVEKIIKTSLVQCVGMSGHTSPVAMGDYIYFNSGPFATMFGMPSGIVRVNKSTKEFDPTYHVDLSKIAGGETGSYCMQMTGVNGKLYFMLHKPSLRSNDNQSDYTNNKDKAPYELNVESKNGKIIGLPATSSWSAQAVLAKDDYVLFGLHATAGSGFYRYYPSSGKMDNTPCVTTPSGAYKVLSLED
ncbi:MAG: DUF4374 domain-containing protein [Bacteroidales bacterium]|nr:DUF4374 domain-containing protein [Bacteroidales bacterium]